MARVASLVSKQKKPWISNSLQVSFFKTFDSIQ